MKTPCEELGYKVGDKFEVLVTGNGFQKGQVIELFDDPYKDGTALFKGDNLHWHIERAGAPGGFLSLDKVKPLKSETQQTENIDPLLSNLTNEELCSRYRFDDNPVIQEFVKRLEEIDNFEEFVEEPEGLVEELEAELDKYK